MNRMMASEIERLPTYWLAAMETSEPDATLTMKVFPRSEGGCEVHIDHPAIKMSESGQIIVS